MNTHYEDWSDFTHTTRMSKVSAQELFERYREFQSFIAGLSRKRAGRTPLAEYLYRAGGLRLSQAAA